MDALAGLRPGVLGIVRRVQQSADVRTADLRERARRSLRVAYVAAREMSEDPRAIALATTAAVVVSVFLVASATRNPLTDAEVKTALRILYAPRRAYRLVRRSVSSRRELGELLQTADPCAHAYALLHLIHGQKAADSKKRVPLHALLAWLRTLGRGADPNLDELANWAEKTEVWWADGSVDTVRAHVVNRLSQTAESMKEGKGLGGVFGDVLGRLVEQLASTKINENTVLITSGGFIKASDRIAAVKALVEYTNPQAGVPLDSVAAYGGKGNEGSLQRAVEKSIRSATDFPLRSVAPLMELRKGPDLNGKMDLFVDEREPYAKSNGRLGQNVFDELEGATDIAGVLKWTLDHVGAICERWYDQKEHMRYVIYTLSAKVVVVCAKDADHKTADQMAYLALAIRVLGRSATIQFPETKAEVGAWVFAAAVRVALTLAKFAKNELQKPEIKDHESGPKRDLNLFHEPEGVSDHATVQNYAELCALLYDESMLLYVAPGIEHDAYSLVNNGTAQNVCAGARLEGRYVHVIPKKRDEKKPSAPHYLAGGSWAVVRAMGAMYAMRSMLAALVPGVANAVIMGVSSAIGSWKVTIAFWLVIRVWVSRQIGVSLANQGIKAQGHYVDAMLGSTPFRALNVACAALTAQETHPDDSSASVMHMLDRDTGRVRIVLDPLSPSAGMDVAPTRARLQVASGPALFALFAPERIMVHFSRGHYGTPEWRAPESWMERMSLRPYATERVVGTASAFEAYTQKQKEYDAAILSWTPTVTLSLAARQYVKEVPGDWLAKTEPPQKPSVAGSTSLYVKAETTYALIAVKRGDDGKLSAELGGLDVLIDAGITTMRITHRDWAYIVNPGSAIRVPQEERGEKANDPMMRLLLALWGAGIRDIGVWWDAPRLMVTIPSRDGTLRVSHKKHEDGAVTPVGATAEFGDAVYDVTVEYTEWSSLFFAHEKGMPVHIHAKAGDAPYVICVSKEGEEVRVEVLGLLHSESGFASDQSVPVERVETLVKALADYVSAARPLYRVLANKHQGSKEVETFERILTRLEGAKESAESAGTVQRAWDLAIGAAYESAKLRRENASDTIEKRLAELVLARFDSDQPFESENALHQAQFRFEAATGMCVTAEQMQTAEMALQSLAKPLKSKIIPAVMGSGKSAVVIPMLALYAAEQKRRVIVVCPHHLVGPMYVSIAVALTQCSVTCKLCRGDPAGAFDIGSGSAVCVLSGHQMQQFVLENGGRVHTEEFRGRTTMIFDEIDGLMDPLTCAFRTTAGLAKAHYLEVAADSYYRAVIAAVNGKEHKIDGDRDGRLFARLKRLVGVLKGKRVRRDFGLASERDAMGRLPVHAVPMTRGVVMEGTRFSDIDVAAVLTARMFMDSEGGYGKADLPHGYRIAVEDENGKVEDARKPGEVCALVAMRTLRTYKSQNVIAFADIAFLCAERVAFSGTVDIPCYVPLGTVKWESTKAEYAWKPVAEVPNCETEAKTKFVEVLNRAGIFLVTPADGEDERSAAKRELTTRVARDTQCVVDVCGLFAGMKAEEVAREIMGSSGLTGVYLDEKRRLKNASCRDGCVYYFSQQNSRGVDVKMKKKIKGAVIVRKGETTLTDAAQGAYRMRYVDTKLEGCGYLHSFDFLVVGSDDKEWKVRDLTNDLKANEHNLAKSRKDLGKKQLGDFATRVEALNSGNQMVYEYTLSETEINRMLSPDADEGEATAVSTSTATSTSTVMASEGVGEGVIESTWYPKLVGRETPDPTWGNFLCGRDLSFDTVLLNAVKEKLDTRVRAVNEKTVLDIAAKRLGFLPPGDPLLPHALGLLLMATDERGARKSTAPSYQAREERGALLDCAGSVNMRRVLHLAQNGAFFARKAEYATLDGAGANLSNARPREPKEPPATAILYTIMSNAQSRALENAIDLFEERLKCKLRITTRMFLEHTRIDSASCIVIKHQINENTGYVLATCADLLLKEIRDLDAASVYFHGHRTVTCKTISLETCETHVPDEAVLYLLASVGAVLKDDHLAKVGDRVTALDREGPSLIALSYKNKSSSTRPHETVAKLLPRRREYDKHAFGRTRTKARYV